MNSLSSSLKKQTINFKMSYYNSSYSSYSSYSSNIASLDSRFDQLMNSMYCQSGSSNSSYSNDYQTAAYYNGLCNAGYSGYTNGASATSVSSNSTFRFGSGSWSSDNLI